MKCINCHKELRDGARFCTVCGTPQPIPTVDSDIPVTEAQDAKPSAKEINTIGQYLFWQVQPGELARIITEREFIEYSSAQGLIVNNGTTACIYKQGQLLTTLQGGKYNFVTSDELERALNQHSGGIAGGLNKIKRFLANLIFGQSVRSRIEDAQQADLLRAQSIDQVLEYLNSDSLYSVVLVQNRVFDLILGDTMQSQNGCANFVPMSIRAQNCDFKVGVRANFKIENIDVMCAHYLVERQTLSAEYLAQQVVAQVETTIQAYFAASDTELTSLQNSGQVSAQGLKYIEDQLREMDFYGIKLQDIVSITCSNADLERFSQLSHNLYVSEQELDYLHKTNEFKNRLATAVNQQLLQEARTDLELMRSLEVINRDRCVTEEDLNRFYIVLSREHRVFEAQDKEKEEQALVEIQRTGLLRNEEIEILRYEVELRRQERNQQAALTRAGRENELRKQQYADGFALKLMQLKDSIDYEMARTSGEAQVDLAQVAHELEITSRKDAYADHRFEVELQRRQQVDDYELQKRKALQRQDNEQMQFEYDIVRQSQADQMKRYREMMEVDAEEADRASKRKIDEEKAYNEHERKIHELDVEAERERNRLKAGMSAEQLVAEQLSRLDKDAQSAYFNAGRNLAQERNLREQQAALYEMQMKRDEELNREMRQQIADIAKQSMAAMVGMSSNMVENRNEQKREYQDELHREQARHDQHQDMALNYTTRQQLVPTTNSSVNGSNTSGNATSQSKSMAKPVHVKVCPQCGQTYPDVEKFCSDCGCELA